MITKILVPLDGSEFAEMAIEPALSLAKAHKAKVLIYGCVSLDDLIGSGVETSPITFAEEWAEKRDNLIKLLDASSVELEKEGVGVEYRWSSGRPTDQIIETCEKEKCDCIVMASHGRSGISRLLLGSVAEGVMRQSTCPVFLIPCPKD